MQTASCRTPFKGLFNVGDTIFAGQGWPGIAIGVDVLNYGVKPIGQSGEIIQAVNLNYILNKISFVD